MFVRQSTFNAMKERALRAEAAAFFRLQDLNKQIAQWNELIGRINALGGEAFLAGRMQKQVPQLSADDIQRLIQLVHPDKHDGKPLANEMTAKLLKLKESIQ